MTTIKRILQAARDVLSDYREVLDLTAGDKNDGGYELADELEAAIKQIEDETHVDPGCGDNAN